MAGSEAVTIGTGLNLELPGDHTESEVTPEGFPGRHLPSQRTRPRRPTLGPPQSRRTSKASTWSSGAFPGLPDPPSSPVLIPTTSQPEPPRSFEVLPGLHLRPLPRPGRPPPNPHSRAPEEVEEGGTPQEGGGGGWRRPARRRARPHAPSVPEGSSSATALAPSLRFRLARPQAPCARVPGSTRPRSGTTSRARAPTHLATRTSTWPLHRAPRKGLLLAHPRRAGARPRSA